MIAVYGWVLLTLVIVDVLQNAILSPGRGLKKLVKG